MKKISPLLSPKVLLAEEKYAAQTYGKYIRLTFFKYPFRGCWNYTSKWQKLQFISICVAQKLHYITTLKNQLYNTSTIRHKDMFFFKWATFFFFFRRAKSQIFK